MKQKKYLKLYKEWSKTGKLPKEGLCKSLSEEEVELFVPTAEEFGRLFASMCYWGYRGRSLYLEESLSITAEQMARDFTPLRQNILLFLACMAGEL